MKKLFLGIIVFIFPLFVSGCSALGFGGKAGLQVMTSNVPAGVYLDGKFMGKTIDGEIKSYLTQELKPSSYTLEIRPDDSNLVPYQTKLSLKKGVLTVVTWKPGTRPETSGGVIYEMETLHNRKNSELSITTIPDGSIIKVDGEDKGFSPILVEHISPGEHEYEVSLPSYETQKHTINVLEGYRMNVTVKLAKQEYVLPDPEPETNSDSVNVASPSADVASASATSRTSVAPSASPSTSSVPKPKVKIKSTGFMNQGQEVLRIRAAASAGSRELGFAPVGSEYPYLQETTQGWLKISFQGEEGWVSGQYAELIQ